MINSVYKNKNILETMKKEFSEKNILKLESLFPLEEYKKIKNKIEKLHFKNKKIPDKFSYEE